MGEGRGEGWGGWMSDDEALNDLTVIEI